MKTLEKHNWAKIIATIGTMFVMLFGTLPSLLSFSSLLSLSFCSPYSLRSHILALALVPPYLLVYRRRSRNLFRNWSEGRRTRNRADYRMEIFKLFVSFMQQHLLFHLRLAIYFCTVTLTTIGYGDIAYLIPSS